MSRSCCNALGAGQGISQLTGVVIVSRSCCNALGAGQGMKSINRGGNCEQVLLYCVKYKIH